MNLPTNPSPDDPREAFDRLLETAKWPVPTAEQEQRVLDKWEELVDEQLTPATRLPGLIRKTAIALAGLAATVLLIAGVRLWSNLNLRGWDKRVVVRSRPTTPLLAPPLPAARGVAVPGRSSSSQSEMPEELANYKSAVSHVLEKRLDDNQVGAKLLSALESLAASPGTTVEELTHDWTPLQLRNAESQLIRRFDLLPNEQQTAAATLLAKVGSRRAIPRLRCLQARPDLQAIAKLGIVRLADAPEVYRCLTTISSLELQVESVSTLLTRDDAIGVAMTFRLVREGHGGIVMQAAQRTRGAGGSPHLVRMLAAARPQDRQLAVQLLAALPSPEVSRQLITCVQQNQMRGQALLVLTMRNDPLAIRFLSHASQDRQLASSVNSARRRRAAIQ